jgi:hypothetical protein
MGTSGAEIGEMNTQQAAMNWDQIHSITKLYCHVTHIIIQQMLTYGADLFDFYNSKCLAKNWMVDFLDIWIFGDSVESFSSKKLKLGELFPVSL